MSLLWTRGFLFFSLLRTIPIGCPSCSNLAKNQGRSQCGKQMDVSSIIDAVWASPPISSPCVFPLVRLLYARCACSLLILLVKAKRTRHENKGLSGHPCGKPSSWMTMVCLFVFVKIPGLTPFVG